MSSRKITGFSSELIGTLEDIPVNEINEPEFQLRKRLEAIEELKTSIEEFGLLHPIVVTIEHDKIRIVTGYRRYEACKKLGWRKIPCHIIDVKDQKEAYEIGLIENLQRSTLNPVEEAQAFEMYVDEIGWGGISELSEKIGKSSSYVSRRILLLELPADIQLLISDSSISVGCGEELGTIKNVMKKTVLSNLILKERPSIRRIRELKLDGSQESLWHSSASTRNEVIKSFDKSIIILKMAAKKTRIRSGRFFN
jgi:ParB family chromosome partitioning protein